MRGWMRWVLAAALLLTACVQHVDGWRSVPPDGAWPNGDALPDARVARILPALQRDACRRLETAEFRQVTHDDAERMCGRSLGTDTPAGWWLVRSVTYMEEGDSIRVHDESGVLVVLRGNMGGAGVMRRQAVLVAPNHEPSLAYADCSSAL